MVVVRDSAMLDVSLNHLTELGYQTFGAEDGRRALDENG